LIEIEVMKELWWLLCFAPTRLVKVRDENAAKGDMGVCLVGSIHKAQFGF